MPEVVRFDDLRIALFIPEDALDDVAGAARATLDDPAFLATLLQTIEQLFAAIPTLAILSVSLDS